MISRSAARVGIRMMRAFVPTRTTALRAEVLATESDRGTRTTALEAEILFALTQPQQTEFFYNGTNGTDGSSQSFIVPAGVTTLVVDAYGAAGGAIGIPGYAVSAPGGRIQASVTVTPGETLHVFVGGKPANANGGYNGGGNSGGGSGGGWGGGGGTDIRRSPYGLADRLVVAGGGGAAGSGTGGGVGGAGGDSVGGSGSPGYSGTGGGGGTQSAGGTAGTSTGDPATAGTLGVGGDGGHNPGGYGQGAGGGGGGYYGGGGGGWEGSAGGGGSNYSSGTIALNQQGVRSGHGYLRLTYGDLVDWRGVRTSAVNTEVVATEASRGVRTTTVITEVLVGP